MTTRDTITSLLTWTPWQPLNGSWLADRLPNLPGLYRIRRHGRPDPTELDYIGQTGSGAMTLKKRLGMLRGVYAPEMPYRDPHTAGPALWALRHATACDFEVSVAPVEGSTPWRKGLECVAISLYREQHGVSPTVNFGRMPHGYRISTSNNAQLVAANKRSRGGLTAEADENHLPGLPPTSQLDGDPLAPDWCAHRWSPWQSLPAPAHLTRSGANGLYRIRQPHAPALLYIGQGLVYARLASHQQKVHHATQRQAPIFTGPLEYSAVLNDTWHTHQRLELENDLIAAYVLHTGSIPAAQFLG